MHYGEKKYLQHKAILNCLLKTQDPLPLRTPNKMTLHPTRIGCAPRTEY